MAEDRSLLANFLRAHVCPEVTTVDAIDLEYEEPLGPLHPSELLGEQGGSRGAGQTSPDLAFTINAGRGLILTENKFVEHSFYSCSARRIGGSEERPGNPDRTRCMDPLAVADVYLVRAVFESFARQLVGHASYSAAPAVRKLAATTDNASTGRGASFGNTDSGRLTTAAGPWGADAWRRPPTPAGRERGPEQRRRRRLVRLRLRGPGSGARCSGPRRSRPTTSSTTRAIFWPSTMAQPGRCCASTSGSTTSRSR